MAQWKKIYETSEPYRAEMIKTLLENNHIPTILLNKQDRLYFWGYFEIHVPDDFFIRALIVLEQSDVR